MFRSPKPLSSVLVKPSGPDCNMGCEYCFYLEKSEMFPEEKVHRMSNETLREMVKQVMEQGGPQISFGWQGGEPTLMGLDFFVRAVDYQKQFGRNGQTCGNGLQTNGTLIDADWARFLHEAKFLVGLSLDGPEHVHDYYRKYAGGKACWADVAAGRDTLLEHGVEVNALVVVNDYSVKHGTEIYQYHKENGLPYMQFIPCVEPDGKKEFKTAPFSVPAEEYGNFLIELFDLWQADFENGIPTTFIRWFDSVFFTYVGMRAPECTLLPECGIYTVVEHNGDVYSCDFFVDPEWKLGNINEDSLTEMLNSEKQQEFGMVKARRPEMCGDCQWLPHCWGGCPKDRQGDAGKQGLDYFCTAYKIFFDHADKTLTDMAASWQRQQLRNEIEAWEKQTGEKFGRNEPCPCNSGKKYKNCCARA